MSTHCDGHDPGTADAKLKTKQEVDIGRPKALRAPDQRDSNQLKARRSSASGQPSSKKTDAMGEPGQKEPLPTNAELSKRSRRGRDEEFRPPRDARQHVESEERGHKPQSETLRLAPGHALGEEAVATRHQVPNMSKTRTEDTDTRKPLAKELLQA